MGNYSKTFFLACVLYYSLFNFEARTQSVSPTTMSLQECVSYALEHNADIQNAQLNVALRKRKAQEALARGLPRVSGKMNFGFNFKIPFSFLPAEIIGGTPGTFIPVAFSPSYSGRMAVDFEQMIFSNSYFIGLKASQSYVNFSKKEREKMRIDLIERVIKAYYLVLVKYSHGELVEKNYVRIDSLLNSTQAQYENGFVEQIDVERIRIQYNNAATEKKNFKKSLSISYALLKFEMGMDVNAPFALKDRLQDLSIENLDPLINDQNFSYENRIEYNIQQHSIQLLAFDIKNSQAKRIPELYLYGNYGGNVGTNTLSQAFQFETNWRQFGIVGLRVDIPIFDGLLKIRSSQQKKIEKVKQENQLSRLKETISMERNTARMTFEQNVEKMNTQKKNMELAENIYRVTKIKYESGVGSNMEVVDANLYLTKAQNSYYQAIYDALVATVDLNKAYGVLKKEIVLKK